jgi:hypothetical protein
MPSTDPEVLRAMWRRKEIRRRLLVLRVYSDGEPACSCCGETRLEFLAIDHIDGGGNLHRKKVGGGGHFYQHLVNEGFPPGYRVLCHNCNLSLGYYGYCPHQESEKSVEQMALISPRKRGNQRHLSRIPALRRKEEREIQAV